MSVTGGTIKIGSLGGGSNDIKNVGGAADPRGDVQQAFRELGFKDVKGLGDVDTAVLGAYAIALNNLERQYGAMGNLDTYGMEVLGMDSASAIAAVRYDANGTPNALLINRSMMGSISKHNAIHRKDEASGWSMPTDGSVKSVSRYTITHEYGHILQTSMYQQAKKSGFKGTEGQYARSAANQITSHAQKRYGATQKHVSQYGSHNTAEFFAEAFANANSGKPNAIGKATSDWLKKQRR